MIKRIKEAVGIGTPDNYASKAMNWLGNAFLLDRAMAGLNDEFWWDQEDRTPLKGREIYDPKMQRLYYATDDFRRKFTYGVCNFLKVPIIAISTLIILVGFAATKLLGPDVENAQWNPPAVEQPSEQKSSGWFSGPSPQEMSDDALLAAIKKMKADGKELNTLNDDDREILEEIERRNLY